MLESAKQIDRTATHIENPLENGFPRQDAHSTGIQDRFAYGQFQFCDE